MKSIIYLQSSDNEKLQTRNSILNQLQFTYEKGVHYALGALLKYEIPYLWPFGQLWLVLESNYKS